MRPFRILFTAAVISTSSLAGAGPLPTTWDGLVEVKSKKLEFVYLLPNADFRSYSKIECDPVGIAMEKNWLQNYNDSAGNPGNRLDVTDVRQALTKASSDFGKYFADEFTNAGYTIVAEPGPDVLRVSPAVLNVSVAAPDSASSTGMTFTADAGQATFVVEVRDSLTNQLLGRAIDQKLAGDTGPAMRTSASNWGEFEDLFKSWARISVQGLSELKSLSPVDTSGVQKR